MYVGKVRRAGKKIGLEYLHKMWTGARSDPTYIRLLQQLIVSDEEMRTAYALYGQPGVEYVLDPSYATELAYSSQAIEL